MIKVGDLVKLTACEGTYLEVYGETGVVVEIDKTTIPELLHIMFSNQFLSFYSDCVETVSHT
jgi:hypothetical protein